MTESLGVGPPLLSGYSPGHLSKPRPERARRGVHQPERVTFQCLSGHPLFHNQVSHLIPSVGHGASKATMAVPGRDLSEGSGL